MSGMVSDLTENDSDGLVPPEQRRGRAVHARGWAADCDGGARKDM